MSFFRRIFSKNKQDDFETVLAVLTNDIQKRQVKLSEIRLREKRSTLLVTLYTLAAWVAYTSLWYLSALPSFTQTTLGHQAPLERTLRGLPVFLGPVVILFIRRIVQIWYTRKADAEEKTLQKLMQQRRAKVDELKKKTNFDSMVKLLQEYDEPPVSPLRKRNPQQPFATPQRPRVNHSELQTPMSTTLQAQLSPVPTPVPIAPPRKRWYDKLADAVLGDDEYDNGSPSSRYALICEKCFTHNGLVKENMWEDAQFICRNPKCNHFNRSVRSKRNVPSLNTTPKSVTTSPSHPPSPLAPSETSSPHRRSVTPDGSTVGDTNADAPTVDHIDAGMMEVDS